jgi:trk system potassium uptake protein TrkA
VKVVIVGDGKVGYALTEELTREGHDVVVIDNRRDVLRYLTEKLDVMVVNGNGASLSVQKAANVGGSDLLIAATSSDEVNMLCCVVARKLGCSHTIARVRNPEYAEQLLWLKEDLGLSMTINPEMATAREIFRLLQFPSFLKRDSFAKGRVEIVEIELKEGSQLIGKKLSDLYQVVKVRALVCAVEREGGVHIPDGGFRLAQGDKIYVTAPSRDLAALIKALDIGRRKVRSALIVGGSRIAHYLAGMLIESGISVKIIESRQARCAELAELLPKADIVHGDGTEREVLTREGIGETDAVVTLTDIDEENLLVSMFANHVGVPKVVTKINRMEYVEVLRNAGIESIVSPKLLCAGDIARYVRAMRSAAGGSAISVHPLVDDRVEALEFVVTKSTLHRGEKLQKIELKPGLLISCIIRGISVIIPRGSDTIELGDTLIVVTNSERAIADLNEIFADGA